MFFCFVVFLAWIITMESTLNCNQKFQMLVLPFRSSDMHVVLLLYSHLYFFLFFNDQMILAYKITGSKRLKTFYSPLIDIRKFLSKIPHSVTKIFFYNWSRNQVLGQEVVITCTYYQCVCHLVKNAYLKKLEHFQKIWYISPNKVL